MSSQLFNFIVDAFLILSHPYDAIVDFGVKNTFLAARFIGRAPYAEVDLRNIGTWISGLYQILLFLFTPLVLLFYPFLRMRPLLSRTIRPPSPELSEKRKGEAWFFINGITIDYRALDQTCQYLEKRFDVGVTGIYNRTYGVLMDILESALQRDFDMHNYSVEVATDAIIAALEDKEIHTVRLISHSQGAIIAGLVLLQLPAEREHLKKLEVYTFANAARKFTTLGGLVGHVEHYANSRDPVARIGVLRHPLLGNAFVNQAKTGHQFNSYYSLDANDYELRPPKAIPKLLSLPAPITNELDHLPIEDS